MMYVRNFGDNFAAVFCSMDIASVFCPIYTLSEIFEIYIRY